MDPNETQEVSDEAQKENKSQDLQEPDEADQMPVERLDHMQKIRNQSLVITQKQTIIPQAPFRKVTMDDSQMKLKYTYGVKAYKYWAIKKNAELKAAWKEICQKDGVSIPPFKPVKTELLACSMSELSFYLASFVNEITKPTGEMYYPDTIFYFCLGIQYYLSENGRSDDVFHDETFVEFIEALNSKLLDSQLRTNEQGLTFCHVTEDHLWEANYLGAKNPYTLLETLVYLNTKNFLLSDINAHLALSFSNVMKQWKKNAVSSDGKPMRTVYLKYNPYNTVQAAVEKKHRVDPTMSYEQLENLEFPLRCPVKFFEFYQSKCPENIKHRNDVFYLQPEPCCVPSSPVWFTANQLDHDIMTMMITRAKVVREVQESFLAQRTMPSSATTATTIQHALANGQAFFVA